MFGKEDLMCIFLVFLSCKRSIMILLVCCLNLNTFIIGINLFSTDLCFYVSVALCV